MDVTEQERLTQELRHRAAYLAEAQRLSHTGSFGWSVLSGEIVWSEETYRIFEYDQAAKPSLELVLQRVHPEDIALVQQVIDRASQDGKDFDLDYRLLIPSGVIKHLHVVAHAVRDESGKIEFVGAVMDVTELKRVEDRERGRSRILESLTTGASLPTILDSLARAIEVEDPTALCTILLLDKERKHLLHGAAPSLPRFFIDAVHGIEIGECVGSCGAAAYTRQRVVVEDLSTHPYWLPYRNLTEKAGLKSCWSEPILAANGQVLGIFGINNAPAAQAEGRENPQEMAPRSFVKMLPLWNYIDKPLSLYRILLPCRIPAWTSYSRWPKPTMGCSLQNKPGKRAFRLPS